ncbi:MAG: glycosyltransferase family 2 protein [Cyanobacteriota bacterium]
MRDYSNLIQSEAALRLTALLLSYNEEANIERTLAALQWVPSIFVIDSGSTDRTLDILASDPKVTILHRPFDSFAEQCNFGLDLIKSEWVLSLDADYVVTPALAEEICAYFYASEPFQYAGFAIPFRYCIAGKPLRGTLLPPRICLYRTAGARYRNDGHGHRVDVPGKVGRLRNPILHDDRKPLERWLASQLRYLTIESRKLQTTPLSQLSTADRLRLKTPLAPLAALVLCLFVNGGILDGWQGWTYAFQRCYAEILLKLMLLETRARRRDPDPKVFDQPKRLRSP